jgi:type IV pilus assembly protein PilM
LEYFRLQSKGRELSEIVLCGGGARVGDIEGYLSREVGLSVQVGDFTSQIQLPDSITAKEKSDLLYDYPVALGLAMRGVK